MRRRTGLVVVGLGVACGLVYMATRSRAAPNPAPPPPAPRTESAPAPRAGGRVPVMVELFTSEGCSSCPPADAELARLSSDQPVRGVEIVALAFHVDYWDRLGWRDPFSSLWASARQRGYASLGNGVYTPQAVVGGATDVLGSRGAAIERAAADAARLPRAQVRITVRPSQRGASAREIDVGVGALPAPITRGRVQVALVQQRAVVKVQLGENAGRSLAHTDIVRTLRSAGDVGAAGGVVHAPIELPAGLTPSAARVVAFVESASPRRVVGVAAADLATH